MVMPTLSADAIASASPSTRRFTNSLAANDSIYSNESNNKRTTTVVTADTIVAIKYSLGSFFIVPFSFQQFLSSVL